MKVPLPIRAVPKLTFEAWLTPPPLGRSRRAADLQVEAGLTRTYFGGVPGFEVGSGPVALAIHGWGGRPAQMVPVARCMADAGYRVIIPSLPGHAGGAKTDLKEVVATLHALIADIGAPEVIVAHSFAAMALRLAFPESAPGRIVLVAPALDVNDALNVFGDRLRLFPWARRGLRSRLEAWDPSLWPTLSNVEPGQLPGADILIVHDPDDRDTPFVRSAELAAIRPDTSIVAVDSAGHGAILSDPTTLDRLLGFVTITELSSHDAA